MSDEFDRMKENFEDELEKSLEDLRKWWKPQDRFERVCVIIVIVILLFLLVSVIFSLPRLG